MNSPTKVRFTEFRNKLSQYLKGFLEGSSEEEIFGIVYRPKNSNEEAQIAAYVISTQAYEDYSRQALNLLSMTDMDSPAQLYKSENYPAEWKGKVPKEIQIRTTVVDTVNGIDLAMLKALCLPMNTIIPCWVNSHGLVYAWTDRGRKIQLKPEEYTIVSWCEDNGNDSK